MIRMQENSFDVQSGNRGDEFAMLAGNLDASAFERTVPSLKKNGGDYPSNRISSDR